MNEQPVNPSEGQPTMPPIEFVGCRFEKSDQFQTVFAIGAWARLTGHGEIVLSMFNEAPPLPSKITYSRNALTKKWVGEHSKEFTDPSSQIVRQILVDIVMPLDSAIRVKDALTNFIEQCQQEKAKKEKAV